MFHRLDERFVDIFKLEVLFENLFVVLNHVMFKDGNPFEKIFEHLFVDVGELVVAEGVFVAPFLDDMGGYSDGGAVFGDFAYDDRVGSDFGIGADRDVSEDFCPCADNDAAFYRRVAFAGNEADSAERHSLIDQDIVFDDRRLADDDAESVVDKDPSTDRSPWMDVDVGEDLVDTH